LIDEPAVGLGQLAGGDAPVAVLLQPGHGDRTKTLLGGGVLREQDGELPAVHPAHQGVQQQALGGAGRADEQGFSWAIRAVRTTSTSSSRSIRVSLSSLRVVRNFSCTA